MRLEIAYTDDPAWKYSQQTKWIEIVLLSVSIEKATRGIAHGRFFKQKKPWAL